MRRPGTAQLELPLLAAAPGEPGEPGEPADPSSLASTPATACGRCGWYRESGLACPVCGTTGAGPRLPPLRRPRREPAP